MDLFNKRKSDLHQDEFTPKCLMIRTAVSLLMLLCVIGRVDGQIGGIPVNIKAVAEIYQHGSDSPLVMKAPQISTDGSGWSWDFSNMPARDAQIFTIGSDRVSDELKEIRFLDKTPVRSEKLFPPMTWWKVETTSRKNQKKVWYLNTHYTRGLKGKVEEGGIEADVSIAFEKISVIKFRPTTSPKK